MSVILFKKGGFKICDEHSFKHELNNGWFLDKIEAEANWTSDLLKAKEPKVDKDTLIKKLRARKAELIAEQNKE